MAELAVNNENVEKTGILNGESTTDLLTKQQRKNKKRKEAKKKQSQLAKENAEEKYTDKTAVKDTSKQVDEQKNNELTDNYEEELCWCIHQIELTLHTQKPTCDQVEKSRKLLLQLKSKKTPKPKIRMLMKQNFGNYREKMAKEEKQARQVTPAHIVEIDEKDMKKSVFLKKRTRDLPSSSSCMESDFCFNFPDPT